MSQEAHPGRKFLTWTLIEEAIKLLHREKYDDDNDIQTLVTLTEEVQVEQRALQKYRDEAMSRAVEGEIEVDTDAIVSVPHGPRGPGAYVACWMWIPVEETLPDEQCRVWTSEQDALSKTDGTVRNDRNENNWLDEYAAVGEDWIRGTAEQLRSLSARLDELGVGADVADDMDRIANDLFHRSKETPDV